MGTSKNLGVSTVSDQSTIINKLIDMEDRDRKEDKDLGDSHTLP